MIIVSDTSPIINLAIIGELHLIKAIFKKVIIPHAVYHEIIKPLMDALIRDARFFVSSHLYKRILVLAGE